MAVAHGADILSSLACNTVPSLAESNPFMSDAYGHFVASRALGIKSIHMALVELPLISITSKFIDERLAYVVCLYLAYGYFTVAASNMLLFFYK